MSDEKPLHYVLRRANSVTNVDNQNQFGYRCNVSCPSTSRSLNSGVENGSHECYTLWEPVNLRQEWTINNIKAALELSTPGICMRSRAFKDEAMPDISWQLCLYPGGKREENKGNVSLFLKMSTSNSTKEFTVRAEYCFFFLDDTGAHKFSNVNTGDFKVKPAKGSHSWGLRNIPKSKVVSSIRQDDSLHIVCEIQTVPDFSRVQSIVLKRESPINQAQFNQDFLNRLHQMFITGNGTDFTIDCEGKEFLVHKFVLMAHSEVLRAMLSHSHLLESKNNRLSITDSSATAVNQMLVYMYSGSLPDGFCDDHAPPLMEIAEKYALDQLKMLCQEKLIQRLSPGNVVQMLYMADVHSANLLLDACIPVVKANSRRVIGSPEWGDLKNTNQHLANLILERIVIQDDSPPQKRLRLNYTQQSNHQ